MNGLSPRKAEVLELLAITGASNAELGEQLGLTSNTVRTHLLTISRMLGCRSKCELIVWAWSSGWLFNRGDGPVSGRSPSNAETERGKPAPGVSRHRSPGEGGAVPLSHEGAT